MGVTVGEDHTMAERDQSRDRPGDEMVRLTVADAAHRLGMSEAGVRKRIQRGQIPYERGDDRRVWVSPGEVRHAESHDEPDQSRAELVEELRDQVRYLRDQLDQERTSSAELRRIVAALTQRIPELPAGTPQAPDSEARESPVSHGPSDTATDTPDADRSSQVAADQRQAAAERRRWTDTTDPSGGPREQTTERPW
jgi:hypothetical protein